MWPTSSVSKVNEDVIWIRLTGNAEELKFGQDIPLVVFFAVLKNYLFIEITKTIILERDGPASTVLL